MKSLEAELDSKQSFALKFLLCSNNIDTFDILSRMHHVAAVEIQGVYGLFHFP